MTEREVRSSKFEVRSIWTGSDYPVGGGDGIARLLGASARRRRVAVRMATSSFASRASGATVVCATRPVSESSRSQYRLSRASFSAIDTSAVRSRRLWLARASSRLAPIDVPEERTWRAKWSGMSCRREICTYNRTMSQAKVKARDSKGRTLVGLTMASLKQVSRRD